MKKLFFSLFGLFVLFFSAQSQIESTSQLVLSAQVTPASCPNVADASIALTITGGTPPYRVYWSNDSTDLVLYNLPAGQIAVAVNDSGNCGVQEIFPIGFNDGPPLVMTKNITVELTGSGKFTLTPEMIDDGSFDDCSQLDLSIDISTFDCDNVGLNSVTLTGVDASGNSSSSVAIVTVVDSERPVLGDCPTDIEINACEPKVITYPVPRATDNCSVEVSLVEGLPSGSTFPAGTTSVTYEAKDPSGNAIQCLFLVVIESDLEIIFLDYTREISCLDTLGGAAEIYIEGGVNPSINWSTGDTTSSISGLSTGNYAVTISEAGCSILEEFVIEETEKPQISAEIMQEPGSNSGSVKINGTTGGQAPYTYEWFDGFGNSIGSGLEMIDLAPGNYTIVVSDSNGCTDDLTFTVKDLSAVAENEFPGIFNIFPNPATNYLTLEIMTKTNGVFNWQIFDINGKLMFQSDLGLKNTDLKEIEISNWSSGIYFFRLETEQNSYCKRIIRL